MEAYRSARLWFYRLRRRVLRKGKKAKTFLPGLPQSLEQSRLTEIFQEQFGGQIASVSHQHLSGWKSSGAYRLLIKSASGKEYFVIFKNAIYAPEEIPALVDFPLTPGQPEYAVLSQASGPLTDFLPRVYLAEEVEPGLHYRYLLEDLGPQYRRLKGDADKLLVIPQIARLHRALDEWVQADNAARLLQYGPDFRIALLQYARTRLEQYQEHAPSTVLRNVLGDWAQITSIYRDPGFLHAPAQLIHGDSNYTNIHVGKQDPRQIKVVDWEWAGFASPFADLASLVKGSLPEFEQQAFQRFMDARKSPQTEGTLPDAFNDFWRHYHWCMLERSLMDAAFLSAQYLDAPNRANFHMPDAVSAALRRMCAAYRQLAG